jgi:hypothetical protein
MSVVRADSVGPSAGGTTRALVRGTAAAWVNFDGTGTIAARDSENVSSLTDNATGDYTVNFSNAFGAGDYSVAMSGGANVFPTIGGTLATSIKIENFSLAGSPADNAQISFSGHGDLA